MLFAIVGPQTIILEIAVTDFEIMWLGVQCKEWSKTEPCGTHLNLETSRILAIDIDASSPSR